MPKKYHILGLALLLSIAPEVTLAQTLQVSSFGFGNLTFGDIVTNLGAKFTAAMTMVASAIFVIGAFFLAFAAGNEERKSLGKSMMIGALVGTGIVYGAHGIFNTVLYFAYGT